MSVKITERDNGYQALLARLAESKATLTVGIHEAEGSAATEDGELTVAEVGEIHEFGTDEIPRRSFIADWSDEKQSENESDLKKTAEAVVKGQLPSIEQGLERLGLKFVGDVQARIRDGIDPPLAESTVEAKGSSTPLIDTGQLVSSIRHRVQNE